MRIISIVVIWMLASCAGAIDSLPAAMAFQVSLQQTASHQVQLEFNLAQGYDVYANRIKISTESSSGVRLGKISFPKPLVIHSDVLGDYAIYTDKFTIPITILHSDTRAFNLNLTFQGCKGLEYCYPAMSRTFYVKLNPNGATNQASITNNSMYQNSKVVSANTATQSIGSAAVDYELQDNNWLHFNLADNLHMHPLWAIFAFFILGVLISFTPCVFPMFPVLLSVIAGRATRSAFLLALVYIIGGSCVYAVTGVIVAYIGISLQSSLQNIWVASVMAMLLAIISLSLFGLFEIRMPHVWQSKLQQRINNRGYSIVGVFLLGAISTLILSPCVTAPLAGALVYISNSHNLIIGGAALFMLGMGIGTPLLFISVVGNQFLPKSGKWMVSVKQFLGMIMLLLALYPLYPYIAFTWVLGIIGMWLIIVSFFIASFFRHRALRILFVTVIFGLGGMLIVSPRAKRIINASTVATTVFNLKVTDATALQSILYLAQAQHKIVVLDFSANWCLACTEMDLTTWRDATLHKLMQDTVNVKIDVTENNSNSLELEKMYHVFAPPAVIIIDQSGNVVRQFMGNIMASPMVKELQQLLGH